MKNQSLTPELLLRAYASGIFPMAESRDDPEIFWVDPHHRGIIPIDGFHLSRSLRRSLLRGSHRITTDAAFDDVVAGCAEREETWISDTIAHLYSVLHEAGAAHSLEVWHDDMLAGGIYGVSIGGAFFGESMFSRARDASKIALAYLLDRLREGGYVLFDTQFLTPHLASLGGIEIPRVDYHRRLADAIRRPADFRAPGAPPEPQLLVQRITQTS